ncbi:MAG: penicillin-insensitive murein endopeptidase [Pseudolabrys sp.]|nr:penicillin-insensitive murein endopeptidase [Pseudolabrys sp.]
MTVAQAPPAAGEPATSVAPIPATPQPAEPAPQPPPVVAEPPAQTPPAAVIAPPAQKPAPVVTVPTPMPPAKPAITQDPKDSLPAKLLFAAKQLPTLGKAMAIGYYPRGCLSGGVELPVTGPTWQVMRVSRNRNWGHPDLIRFLEKFAPRAAKSTGWKGILVGDLAQPRGGPTPSDHKSHQTGLDVDIWFMPMPSHVLSKDERDKIAAPNVVADNWKELNPKNWTPQHIAFIKAAADQPEVERVLVNAAIKQELCRVEGKNKDGWMSKVRPWYGHHDHIHVRLKCPADSPNCRAQPPLPGDDGCGKNALDYWFSDKVLRPQKPTTPTTPKTPPKALTLADLPPACKTVLSAPARE